MRQLLIALFYFLLQLLTAQAAPPVYSLEECLAVAERLSPELESRRLADRTAAQATVGALKEGLPTANFQSRLGYQFGRSIDPTTNSFADQGILFNSTGVSAEWTAFDGGSRRAAIERTELDQLATELETELTARNLRERIIIVYGKALEARANLDLQEKLLLNQRNRLQELDRLINAGIYPANDRLEPALKLSRLERERVLAEQQYGFLQRELSAHIGLDNHELIQPAAVKSNDDLTEPATPLTFDQSVEGRLAAAQTDRAAANQRVIKLANGPRLTVFGQLATNYSAAARELVGIESIMATQNVMINGAESELSAEQQLPIYDDKAVFNQLGDNFNQVIGLQLSVPIYDGGRNSNQRQVAALQQQRSLADRELQRRQYAISRSQLENAVREADINYDMAREQLVFAQQTLEQAETAFRRGGISAADVSRVEDEVSLAAIQEIRARYTHYINVQLLQLISIKY